MPPVGKTGLTDAQQAAAYYARKRRRDARIAAAALVPQGDPLLDFQTAELSGYIVTVQ